MESEDAQNEGNLDIEENNTEIEEPKPEEGTTSPSMETLLEEDELSLDFPRAGETRTGIIVSISEDQILVGIGTKSEGIIPKKDLDKLEPEDLDDLEVGKEIPVYVVTPEDSHGNLLLSFSLAVEEKDWGLAEDLLESGEVYEGEITGYNKGGLIVNVGKLRGFVPGSQISLSRRMAYSGNTPDQRWGKMVGEPIATRVIEVDRERRRLILSERAALQEARELLKERLLDELEEGQVHTGRVTSLADFGAFVNIQGADGLVHLTEISWERINHPSEVLKVGQEVDVKVIDIDQDRKRIGLSIRQLQDDPWPEKVSDLQVGQLVEGQIVRLVKFGAFARIQDRDIEGLIHISELSDTRIEHPKEVLSEGDTLTFRVVNIDPKRHRVELSLRKVDSPQYANLDWELALAEGIEGLAEAEDEEEIEIEAAAAEVVEEIVAEAAEEVVEVEAAAEEEVAEIVAEAAEEVVVVEAVAEVVVEEIVAETAEEVVEVEAVAEVVVEEIVAETAEEVVEVEAVADEIVEEIVTEAAEDVAEVEAAADEVVEEIVAEAAEEIAEVEEVADDVVEDIAAEAADEIVEVEAAADETVEDILAEAAEEISEAPTSEAVEEIIAEAVEEITEVKEAAEEEVEEIAIEAVEEVAEIEAAAEKVTEEIIAEAADEVIEVEAAADEVVEEIVTEAAEEVIEVEAAMDEDVEEIVAEAAEEVIEVEAAMDEDVEEIVAEAAEEVIEVEAAADEVVEEIVADVAEEVIEVEAAAEEVLEEDSEIVAAAETLEEESVDEEADSSEEKTETPE